MLSFRCLVFSAFPVAVFLILLFHVVRFLLDSVEACARGDLFYCLEWFVCALVVVLFGCVSSFVVSRPSFFHFFRPSFLYQLTLFCTIHSLFRVGFCWFSGTTFLVARVTTTHVIVAHAH